MAEALVDTIPCERCNIQIELQDWSEHVTKCFDDRNNRLKREKRNTSDDESDFERIPCEFCDALINIDDWNSHLKMCANTHTRPIENWRNFDDEPIDTSILCEYCNTQVSVYDLERHTRQCANDRRGRSKKSEKDERALIPCDLCNAQVSEHERERHMRECADKYKDRSKKSENPNDESPLIPCEFCNATVSAHEWKSHANKCAQAEKQRIEDLAKRIAKAQSDELIPCEYCGKSFPLRKLEAHEKKCRRMQRASTVRSDTPQNQAVGNKFTLPEHWDGSSPKNLTRYKLDPKTVEYKFVADNFQKTLPTNQIVQIERIQNRRWYRQYDAHKDDFIERHGNSTEQWLFHGCRRSESAEAIILDCFNRSHAVNCAVGQGIYFATQAAISHGYTHPDTKQQRHMFMARVLVGKTTVGNPATRVCPPGFDTTGGGNVFVTYHDAQAYAQYLIVYR